MKIRRYTDDDFKSAANLIRQNFKLYNSSFGTKKGIESYLDHLDIKKNGQKLFNTFHNSPIHFVAEENGKIIGIVRGSPEKLSHLFIKGSHQKTGVGSALLKKFELSARKKGAKRIKINSSPNAVNFYQKHGYKRTTGLRNMNGITVQPMKKKIPT